MRANIPAIPSEAFFQVSRFFLMSVLTLVAGSAWGSESAATSVSGSCEASFSSGSGHFENPHYFQALLDLGLDLAMAHQSRSLQSQQAHPRSRFFHLIVPDLLVASLLLVSLLLFQLLASRPLDVSHLLFFFSLFQLFVLHQPHVAVLVLLDAFFRLPLPAQYQPDAAFLLPVSCFLPPLPLPDADILFLPVVFFPLQPIPLLPSPWLGEPLPLSACELCFTFSF